MSTQFQKRTLNRLWAGTGLGALAAIVVLQTIEGILKAKTGIGTADLQMTDNGVAFRFLMDRWQAPAEATLAGFSLGFDFLFLPLYGTALYCGTLSARDRFAPNPGFPRRILNAITLAAPIAVVCDVCENVLEMVMLTTGANDVLAAFAFDASTMKFSAIVLALVVNLAAIAGLIFKKQP